MTAGMVRVTNRVTTPGSGSGSPTEQAVDEHVRLEHAQPLGGVRHLLVEVFDQERHVRDGRAGA